MRRQRDIQPIAHATTQGDVRRMLLGLALSVVAALSLSCTRAADDPASGAGDPASTQRSADRGADAPRRSPAPGAPPSPAASAAAAPASAPPAPDAVALNNRGVGLLGSFEFEEAQAAFEAALAIEPTWTEAIVNRAIAILNQASEGRQEEAIAILAPVLASDPLHLRANYATGLCELFLGEPEKAVARFAQVAKADRDDAYAAYYHGQCLELVGEANAALAEYRRAADLDPYLRSAFLGMQRGLQRTGDALGAAQALDTFMALAENPRARLAEFKYTRMGRKGEAIAVPTSTVVPAQPTGAVFEAPALLAQPPEGWSWSGSPLPRSITVADIDGDGGLDLFITAALRDRSGASRNAVILHGADGGFTVDGDHPLAAIPMVEAALWGDVDNDGRTDVVLCSKGGSRLWRRTETGWSDATAASRVFAGAPSTGGLLADLDHDGDLDCLLVAGGQGGREAQFLVNLDGAAFKDITAAAIPASVRVAQAVAGDFDGDRDLDILLRGNGTPNVLLRNDRLWNWAPWEPAIAVAALADHEATAAAAGDVDGDGSIDLVLLAADGVPTLFSFPQRGGGEARAPRSLAALPVGSEGFALADLRGDGTLTPFAPGAAGTFPAHRGWVLALLDPLRGPSLVSIDEQGAPSRAAPGPGRFDFSAISFRGRLDPGQSMRSNASGIGTLANARIGERWVTRAAMPLSSARGQSIEPVSIGLGGAPAIDFVSIDWSDGVFQSELGIAPGGPHVIVETQRQISSCPLLFVWDGTRHRFVSDLLGVGGLGYLVAPGEYAPSRPWEYFLLPEGLPAEHNGALEIVLHEPMEEAVYLDFVALHVFDLPAEWDLVMDERMATGGPEPTGEPRFLRELRLPTSASMAWGGERRECVADIAAADFAAAPTGPVDARHIGRMLDEHVLTLEFDAPLEGPPDLVPLLVAHGWVEYPYSQTNFAAWQSGATFDAPTLEARAADGAWSVLLERFGYPAGMPRSMSVPLPPLPTGCTALRLRSNLEIHWDMVAVGFAAADAQAAPDVVRRTLPLVGAELDESGFPQRSDGPGRRPIYDHGQRAPLADMKTQVGWYTTFGPVEELVDRMDGALAIFGPGEEVRARFGPVPPPPSGHRRRHVLEVRGWCKDMDLFTRDGETLMPIPGTRPPDVDALHRRYNVRFGGGRS